MRVPLAVPCAAVLAALHSAPACGESMDSRVIQVTLPADDVTLSYVERQPGFTVRLQTPSASVEGEKLYIGDGAVAIDLVAHPSQGIFLQGVMYRQGDKFEKGRIIKLRPGHKKATELKPGEVYVVLPGVSFELPME